MLVKNSAVSRNEMEISRVKAGIIEHFWQAVLSIVQVKKMKFMVNLKFMAEIKVNLPPAAHDFILGTA